MSEELEQKEEQKTEEKAKVEAMWGAVDRCDVEEIYRDVSFVCAPRQAKEGEIV